MIPPHWDSNREKPMCGNCGCVEFSEDLVCEGCGEPLVVRPFRRLTAIKLIAADKWGNHWPKDYESRCFLCGWKSRKTLSSLVPTSIEDIMTASMWAIGPEAKRLGEVICPERTLSDRLQNIMGVLSHTGENALFKVAANKGYLKLAAKYEGKNLSFCRKCAEQDATPVPAELPVPTGVSLTESMASAMSDGMKNPIPVPSNVKGPVMPSKTIRSFADLIDSKLTKASLPKAPAMKTRETFSVHTSPKPTPTTEFGMDDSDWNGSNGAEWGEDTEEDNDEYLEDAVDEVLDDEGEEDDLDEDEDDDWGEDSSDEVSQDGGGDW